MKKLLKIVGIIFIIIIILGIIASAGGGSDKKDKKEIVTDSSGDSNSNDTSSNEDDSTADKSKPTDVTIDEQVLFEKDGLKVTATEYKKDSVWGDGINLLIENDSDSSIGLGCTALIVNDYMITDLFSSTVAAGKKSNEMM